MNLLSKELKQEALVSESECFSVEIKSLTVLPPM